MTGHANGVITLNLAEADDAERERRRVQLYEPQRTLVGHFRHESGHYYWSVLIAELRVARARPRAVRRRARGLCRGPRRVLRQWPVGDLAG